MTSVDDFKKLAKRPPGEAKVYLAGMGLAIGILMMAWLLFIVITNGLAAFWPDRVVEYTMKNGGKMYGEEKSREVMKDVGKVVGHQTKVFTGNRDLLGQSTIFVPDSLVESVKKPSATIINIERLEWGNVIGVPNELKLAEGRTVKASDPEFTSLLSMRVKHFKELRSEINDLEKGEIGGLGEKIGKAQRAIRKIRYDVEKKNITQEVAIERESKQQKIIDEANGSSAALIEKARKLRLGLETDSVSYTLADGKSNEVKLGSVLGFYYPNELGFWGRIGQFFHKGWNFLTEEPREANMEGGVFPCIFGTLLMTIVMSLLVTPLGVLAAVYLREYAKQGPFVRLVRISVNNLAGVPSIVFGVFGLGFFVYTVGGSIDNLFYPGEAANGIPFFKSGNILWASMTLALLTLPVVIVATEESLSSVSRGLREAALACGASKWQALQRVIIPSSLPGIMTGVILAMARGAGEVAPLMVVGVVKLAPELPIDITWPFGLDHKFMHLGFHIYDLGFQSPDAEAAKPMVFATTLLLITTVVTMNLAAIILRNRLRKKLAVTTF